MWVSQQLHTTLTVPALRVVVLYTLRKQAETYERGANPAPRQTKSEGSLMFRVCIT
jgi:hypothetical protein